MNEQGILGALLPLWIIGAPLLIGVLMLFQTPKPKARDHRDVNAPRERPPISGDPYASMPAMAGRRT